MKVLVSGGAGYIGSYEVVHLSKKRVLMNCFRVFNILRKDTSIVGPKLERSHFVSQFKDEILKYMIKHHVWPGIAGWTPWFDVKIFFMTFKAVFKSGY